MERTGCKGLERIERVIWYCDRVCNGDCDGDWHGVWRGPGRTAGSEEDGGGEGGEKVHFFLKVAVYFWKNFRIMEFSFRFEWINSENCFRERVVLCDLYNSWLLVGRASTEKGCVAGNEKP